MTSAEYLMFTPDSLSESSKRIEQARVSIGRSLDDLSSQATMLNGQWTGEANEAFTAAHAKWAAEFDRMNGILNHVVSALTVAADDYAEVEKENESRWPR